LLYVEGEGKLLVKNAFKDDTYLNIYAAIAYQHIYEKSAE